MSHDVFHNIPTDDRTDPEQNTVSVDAIHHPYIQLGNREGISAEDMEYGVRYRGVVNGVQPYGVFVTVANFGTNDDELTGLAHEKLLPPLHTPQDYTPGDVVGVVLVHRPSNDRPQLEIVSNIQTQKGDRGEYHSRMAPISDDDTLVTYDENLAHDTLIEVEGDATAAEMASTLKTLSTMLAELPKNANLDVSLSLEQRGDD